ncbi:signal peptide peptidase SppA [Desulfopila sp. IMCC35008]|uniref:signal peptide peptidase SppA n=1 Tax=Desulfopila sp. IMCC35008 TaxID=2653858 RepID=UPI0013D67E80|nr:signal peptide peptidase SppA [Desulfopila sp. IMCC35008]
MKNLIKIILAIFSFIGSTFTFLRNTFFNILFFSILMLVIIGLLQEHDNTEPPQNAILRLTLSGDIVEENRHDPGFDRYLEEYLGIDQKPHKLLLRRILTTIESAATDESVTMILLDLKEIGRISLDQMQVIGQALNDFKKSGKKVIAAEDFYTQKQYLLASFADTIILNPMGGVDIHGFGSYPLYFKSFLDKMRVNYHIFRVGTYKSAIEPLTRNDMSPEARYQNQKWLDDLWDIYSDTIANHRGIKKYDITDYVENISSNLLVTGGDTALLAINSGLVDKLLTRNELVVYLATENNQEPDEEPVMLSSLSYQAPENTYAVTESEDNDTIAVIVAEGNIVGGKQPPGIIGSETLTEKIREARLDADIRGLVLRINSGGGSAFSSEVIRQELLEFKKSGKPVVISMGEVAASGGYWIAAEADRIIAAPTSLTGSIGIFGAIPTFERSLEYLGIHSDGVGSTSLSAGLNLAQPLSDQMKESIQLSVDFGYDRFLTIVAGGRNINKTSLSPIAEGRVFSGKEALKVGLIDQTGYLNDAIKVAAEIAGVTDYSVRYIEKQGTFSDMFFQRFTEVLADASPHRIALPETLRKLLKFLFQEHEASLLSDDPQGIYALSGIRFTP